MSRVMFVMYSLAEYTLDSLYIPLAEIATIVLLQWGIPHKEMFLITNHI